MYAPNNYRKDNFFMVALCTILAAILFCGLAGCSTNANADSNEANPPRSRADVFFVDCGTCGAHVLEWWRVRSDDGKQWVNVCIRCADAMEK